MYVNSRTAAIAFQLLAILGCTTAATAIEPVSYQAEIRQLFRQHCAGCHNTNRSRGGLDLSSYAGAIQGSSSGKVLVAGDPSDSILFLCLTHEEEPAMPPGKDRLEDTLIERVKAWIALGMPETSEQALAAAAEFTEDPSTSASAEPASAEIASSVAKDATSASSMHDVPGKLVATPVFRGNRATPVTALAVSPDGKTAAVGGQLQVLIYDLPSRSLTGVLPFPEGEAFVLRFRGDGARLLAGGGVHAESGKVVIWDMGSGRRVRELGDEFDVVLAADLSPRGDAVLLGGPERIVKLVDVASSRVRATLKKHTDWVLAASFSPEGLLCATADRAGNLYAWETPTGADLFTLRGHRGAVTSINWSPDSNFCISGGQDGTIRVWDMHTGKQVRQWAAHEDGVLSLDVTSDGTINSVGRDNTIKQWRLDGKILRTTALPELPLLVASLDAERKLVGDWSGQIEIWDLRQQASLAALEPPADLVTADISAIVQVFHPPSAPAPIAPAPLPAETGAGTAGDVATARGSDVGNRVAGGAELAPLAGAIAQLQAAEEKLRQARAAVVSAQRALAPAANPPIRGAKPSIQREELAAAWASLPARRARVATLESLVKAFEEAERLVESASGETVKDGRSVEIDVLNSVSLEKARAALAEAKSEQASSESTLREAYSRAMARAGGDGPDRAAASARSELVVALERLDEALGAWTAASARLAAIGGGGANEAGNVPGARTSEVDVSTSGD